MRCKFNTFAPVSSPIALDTTGDVPSSVNIALTWLSIMAVLRAAKSAADTSACEDILGTITPTSLKHTAGQNIPSTHDR